MAQRTTKKLVQALLEAGRDYDKNIKPDLQPFVDTAWSMVDRVSACALAKSPVFTHTAAELELIERWVAAWAYKNADQQYASKSTAGASGSYKGQTGMFLESNHYGQTALALDQSGCLKAVATPGNRARGRWLGKRPSEQVRYTDRN